LFQGLVILKKQENNVLKFLIKLIGITDFIEKTLGIK